MAARAIRFTLQGRYRFCDLAGFSGSTDARVGDPRYATVDFLGSSVLSTDAPELLLFARYDIVAPKDPPPFFDISIDGKTDIKVAATNLLMPVRVTLSGRGQHVVKVRANPLRYRDVGKPFPLEQNVVLAAAVRKQYRLSAIRAPEPTHSFVTVTDSIGQGYETPNPPEDAWTALLASSGRWSGSVLNRGYVGALLSDLCNSASTCDAFAGSLNHDYPNAGAYYIALGTNDYAAKNPCLSAEQFGGDTLWLLQALHALNPQAKIYLQTPIHRADEKKQNLCGNTLLDFKNAEILAVHNLPWVEIIDGFSVQFPQPGGPANLFVDRVHLTREGQQQYLNAVLLSLHL